MNISHTKFFIGRFALPLCLALATLSGLLVLSALPQRAVPPAPASGIVLQLDPMQSKVHWSLGTTLHTVHGTFNFKSGSLQLDPATGKANGEIVVYATSGESGNDSRDKKMHNDVLESARHPDIIFRPDRFEGKLAQEGFSTIQIHGVFVLRGVEHEMTVPATGEFHGDEWSGRAKFTIPFIDWGLKNPSNFFLKVNHTVDLDVQLKGKLQIPGAPHA